MPAVNNSQSIGALIRKERKQQKVTQYELATLAGVGVRFLRELEHGKATCQLGRALLVMQTLGLKLTITNRQCS